MLLFSYTVAVFWLNKINGFFCCCCLGGWVLFCFVFCCWPFLKSIELSTILLLLFYVLVFYHKTCRTLTPEQGLNPYPLFWKAKSPNYWTAT